MDNHIKVGIMGGTFDPIHYGHLVTAEAVRYKFNLAKVIFVPSGNPPHKEARVITEKKHRYLMTILATVTNPNFEVSAIELNKEGYTYTVDTMKEFKTIYGENFEFYFITGADAILEILKWKDIDTLLNLCNFVAATRPGFNTKDLADKLEYIKKTYDKDIFRVEVPSLAISSTDIRQRVAHGEPIKYLLPEAVERYIQKNHLYQE
ncbi:nicotinate-nucleotide adenylyltransferase [Calorimonas adulescens]|uniref:Probable nicotinate-nucleotide adenylyltransferase n=1 Tax=Calorimonas adulescens TaxID=2606906 RepID=A0A5D8QD36_9THEO|nr:nicotinate-nucleotide adenylyltransferase [Calorimonas adulescens]TZE82327.1 nicotinate-nucleotide adenylyltransferase [Calorimonas adulescens]